VSQIPTGLKALQALFAGQKAASVRGALSKMGPSWLTAMMNNAGAAEDVVGFVRGARAETLIHTANKLGFMDVDGIPLVKAVATNRKAVERAVLRKIRETAMDAGGETAAAAVKAETPFPTTPLQVPVKGGAPFRKQLKPTEVTPPYVEEAEGLRAGKKFVSRLKKQRGTLSLPQGSGQPASVARIPDEGMVAPGPVDDLTRMRMREAEMNAAAESMYRAKRANQYEQEISGWADREAKRTIANIKRGSATVEEQRKLKARILNKMGKEYADEAMASFASETQPVVEAARGKVMGERTARRQLDSLRRRAKGGDTEAARKLAEGEGDFLEGDIRDAARSERMTLGTMAEDNPATRVGRPAKKDGRMLSSFKKYPVGTTVGAAAGAAGLFDILEGAGAEDLVTPKRAARDTRAQVEAYNRFLLDKAQVERLTADTNVNIARLAKESPHLYNEMLYRRRLPRGAIPIGGNPDDQFVRQVGTMMAQGAFRPASSANDELQAMMGV
jgi:hypothetical protein